MPNIPVIKKNIASMISQGANQPEIDLYVSSHGITPDDLRTSKYTLSRAGWQMFGGAVGGAVASPGIVTTPVGVGLGSAIAGQAHDLYKETIGRKLTENPVERARGAAEDFVLDVISPIALSKGIYGIKKAGAGIVGKTRGFFKPAEYHVYQKYGIKPTAALATQSRGLTIAEHALSDFPMTADIFQKQAQENLTQLNLANRFLAKEYGPILNKEEIGLMFKKVSPEVLEHYTEVYNKLFAKISKEIGPQNQKIDNTLQMLNTLVRETRTGPNSGVTNLATEIVDKADGLGLPWESLKKYRTKIGDMMKSPELVSTRNIQSGDLKRLYGAMTRDMETAAKKSSEKVHARWRAANKYFETKLTRDIPILEEIIKKKYPEEVFDVVMRSSTKGGSRLRLLRKQLGEKKWDAVAGSVLGKMGEQTSSAAAGGEKVFSPATFMTNWHKLSTTAKRSLFRGGKYEGLAKELNDFVRVVGNMKSVEQLANRSHTGSVLMFYGLFQSAAGSTGAMFGGEAGLAAGIGVGTMMVGAPRLTARLLTNQKFVRWVNKGFQIAKTSPNSMPVHLGRLMVLRFKEDAQDDIDNLIHSILNKD